MIWSNDSREIMNYSYKNNYNSFNVRKNNNVVHNIKYTIIN